MTTNTNDEKPKRGSEEALEMIAEDARKADAARLEAVLSGEDPEPLRGA